MLQAMLLKEEHVAPILALKAKCMSSNHLVQKNQLEGWEELLCSAEGGSQCELAERLKLLASIKENPALAGYDKER